jgi:hypothetical protein
MRKITLAIAIALACEAAAGGLAVSPSGDRKDPT